MLANTMHQPGSDVMYPLPSIRGLTDDLYRVLRQLKETPSSVVMDIHETLENH
jgi:hypothetical protein